MVSTQPGYVIPKVRIRQRLSAWFRQQLGSGLLSLEHAHLDQSLNNLFGYHILQLGNLNNISLLSHSRISHKVVVDFFRDNDPASITNLVSDSESFPIESESMDVVVLPHTLEFETTPHQVLREANRVLIGEGHLIIIGFNPWSLWGLWRLFLAWRDRPPWNGKFIALPRIKDWLSLLDFELISTEHFYFRPPLKNQKFLQRLLFMEKAGKYLCPFLGGVYIVVAKKRVAPLTPIKLQWRRRRRLIASGVTEPTTRLQPSELSNHREYKQTD